MKTGAYPKTAKLLLVCNVPITENLLSRFSKVISPPFLNSKTPLTSTLLGAFISLVAKEPFIFKTPDCNSVELNSSEYMSFYQIKIKEGASAYTFFFLSEQNNTG